MYHLQTVFFDHYFCINRDLAFSILLFYKQKFGDTALKNPTRENPEYMDLQNVTAFLLNTGDVMMYSVHIGNDVKIREIF